MHTASTARATESVSDDHRDLPTSAPRVFELQSAHERTLAELQHSARLTASVLRFAAIPTDDLDQEPATAPILRAWRRAQDYLVRAAREWPRRVADRADLRARINELASELAREAPALGANLSGHADACLATLLNLDRQLTGHLRELTAGIRFGEELARCLGVLTDV